MEQAGDNVEENYRATVQQLDEMLRIGESFDLIRRTMTVASEHCEATLYYIDGFVKDEVTVRLMEYYQKAGSAAEIRQNLPYTEVETTDDFQLAVDRLLSGATLMVIESLCGILIVDTRDYPTRALQEPESDRVLRGPRDGFCETLIFNTALIRRRIRDPRLTMSIKSIGTMTKTDVVLCYIAGRADAQYVKHISDKLDSIHIKALNLGQESLAELLVQKAWYNPFPKVRFTERPDAAAAMLFEGSVMILCDNTPAVMILPTSIFDFLQQTDDYYFPPVVGTYLRLIRLFIFLATVLLTPIWYLLIRNPDWIPPALSFIRVVNAGSVPIIAQLLLVEIMVDGLKLASLNTPSALTNSLSVIGGLILGDFAVQVGWLIPEVILYMAFVSIANYTQTSYELGYAFKFMRMLLLIATALFNVWGLIGAFILMLVLIATNKTVDGSRSYLYPLIPWNGKAMKRLLFRVRLK